MKTPLLLVLLMLAAFIFTGTAPGKDLSSEDMSIGKIKKVAGQVTIRRSGEKIPATAGEDILRNDVLETGADGSMGIILSDNAILSMGENSRLAMAEYAFDPAVNKLSCLVDVFKGTMTYLTGIIGKINPEAVRFKTPTATIGIRGTHLAINVEE